MANHSRNSTAWGDGLRQRLRLAPLAFAMRFGDTLARWGPSRRPHLPAWQPGLSVVIPERDAPAMLEEALAHLFAAMTGIAEPHQVIVVVNGSGAGPYAQLAQRWPSIEWRVHA